MSLRVFAPGRVNLIGDHIDYLGGDVLPMALPLGTEVTLTPADAFEFVSAQYPERWTGDDWPQPSGQWFDYVVGCIQLWPDSTPVRPCRIAVTGDLPRGSGLSSSASLEVAVLTALNAWLNAGLSPTEVALLGQRVEREWIGLNCGIMDQYASAWGAAGHALHVDCSGPRHVQVPLTLGDSGFWVVNSKAPRGLPGSLYNERVAETAEIASRLGIAGALARADVNAADALPPRLRQRFRHVVSEQRRVGQFVEAAAARDVLSMGALMNESHASLRDDYEVSGEDLDALQAALVACPGVLGARMTGGGFGGCVVALIRNDAAASVRDQVRSDYQTSRGRTPDFIGGTPSAGARVL